MPYFLQKFNTDIVNVITVNINTIIYSVTIYGHGCLILESRLFHILNLKHHIIE
jgi:hypothetical protein